MLTFDDLDTDQVSCVDFLLDGEDALVLADIGSGKTPIALTAMNANNDEGCAMVSRWLVVAPLLVCDNVWQYEHRLWGHLANFDVRCATGDPEQRKNIIESDAEVVVINYENLLWLLDEYPIARIRRSKEKRSTLPFDGVVFDELDKLKSVSSQRFAALRNQVPFFQKRIGLTGTPTPNDLLEIWGQTFVIDGGETFGRSFYKWRREFFYPIDYDQRQWKPHPGTYEMILEKLQGLAFRLENKNLPELAIQPAHKLPLPLELRPVYDELHKELYVEVEGDEGETHIVDAASQGVLVQKLQQVCAGFSYVAPKQCHRCKGNQGLFLNPKTSKYACKFCDNKPVPNDAVWHGDGKLGWLSDLLEQHRGLGLQTLVFYHFNEERDELLRRFPDMPYLGKGVSRRKQNAHILAWNEGRISELALHPASAGHGLNLQKSSAHHIALLTAPWSGGLFRQLIGRLRRRGQLAERIYVHTAAFSDTIDEDVLATLAAKGDLLDNFLDDLMAWQNGARPSAA